MIVMYISGGPTAFHAQHLAERITQVGAPVFDGRPYVVAGDEGASELVQLMSEKAFAISPKVGANRV
jgi:hypothetical protein